MEDGMADYDLAALWEAHCRYEFEDRDVDATMASMVEQPYVNHVPTMTGGVGHDQLKRFYRYHFIGANPDDTELVPVSRTVGSTSLVDEMLFRFTHTREVDWMLPGVPPPGRRGPGELRWCRRRRPAGPGGPAGHGCGSGSQGVGQVAAQQRAHAQLVQQRRQAAVTPFPRH